MAALQEFSIARAGHRSVRSPTYTITALVYDNDGALVADFTGVNAINYPGVLDTFPDDVLDEFLRTVAQWVVLHQAGIPNG